jgi:hypothetical protein
MSAAGKSNGSLAGRSTSAGWLFATNFTLMTYKDFFTWLRLSSG